VRVRRIRRFSVGFREQLTHQPNPPGEREVNPRARIEECPTKLTALFSIQATGRSESGSFVCQRAETIDDSGGQFLQEWKHLAPDANPEKARIRIRRVGAGFEPPPLAMGDDRPS
jgi:hypothetical protein